MRIPRFFAAILALAAPLARAEEKALTTDEQKASYALGRDAVHNLKTQGVPVIEEAYLLGAREAFSGAPERFTSQETTSLFDGLRTKIQEQKKAAGAAYLKANKKKDGVKVTKSGLQYKILAPGTGASPKKDDKVRVHYRGTLIDGTEFDSSYKREQPAEFPLGNVIPGWTEGLQLIKTGGKIQLTVPSDLAYGDRGRPPTIPPFSVLIFEVELLEILK